MLVARSELEAVLGFLRKAVTLVVTKIDRLARNTRVLGQIVDRLHALGIALKVLQFGKETVDVAASQGRVHAACLGL